MDLIELQKKNVQSPLRFLKAIDLERINHISEIAKGEGLKIFEVPSASKKDVVYHVRLGSLGSSCTCPDFVHRGVECKHILACKIRSGKGAALDLESSITDNIDNKIQRGRAPGLSKHPRHEDAEEEAPGKIGHAPGRVGR